MKVARAMILRACVALLPLLAVAQSSGLIAQNAWIRAVPGADMAAAYLTLHNAGTTPLTVTAVQSPVAAQATIHETKVLAGQSQMRPQEKIVIAAGASVKLEPGGFHVMLHDLKQPLKVGQNVPLVFTLQGGGTLEIVATVRPLNAE